MEMRRFVGRLAGFVAVQALLAGPLVYAIVHRPPGSYLAASRRKHERLERLAPPRIVFVGGSATAFGIDSPRIEQALRRPVVNLGLFLPLGLDLMLNEMAGEVRSGDIVVVSPEFSLFFNSPSVDARRRLVEVNPAALFWLPPREARQFIDRAHKPLGTMARREIARLLRGEKAVSEEFPPYSLDSFNEQGDVVAHHTMASSQLERKRYHLGPPDDPGFRLQVERLNRFHRVCVSKGARAFYSYPAVTREAAEVQRASFDAIVAELERSLEMPRLHDAGVMIFPASLFFDSTEHLGLEGKMRRSDILLERLRPLVGR
jgi:hypothetical protein